MKFTTKSTLHHGISHFYGHYVMFLLNGIALKVKFWLIDKKTVTRDSKAVILNAEERKKRPIITIKMHCIFGGICS